MTELDPQLRESLYVAILSETSHIYMHTYSHAYACILTCMHAYSHACIHTVHVEHRYSHACIYIGVRRVARDLPPAEQGTDAGEMRVRCR